MKAKPGYKLVKWFYGTKLEIPEKWELIKLKNLTERGNQGVNTAIDKVDYVSNGIPLLKAGDLKKKDTLERTDTISEESFKNIPQHHKTEKYDILYANIGSALGTATLVTWDCKCAIAWNVFLIKIKNNFNSKYLTYFLNGYEIYNRLRSIATQSTMPFISKPTLFSLDVIVPILQEQQKIASILYNIDNVISSYDDSINSTKKLKIGLMQTLLTKGIGHKKFKKIKGLFGKKIKIPEEWNVKNFDELFEFIISGTNPRKDLGKEGDIYYIHYGDIHTQWNGLILDCNSEKIPQIEKTKVERIPLLKEGDLIIVDVSEDYEGSCTSILLKNVKNKKIVAGLHTFALRADDETTMLDYRRYITSNRFVKRQIISYVTGTSVLGISKNNLKKVKICLPEIDEQQKIASILVNVDENIIDLEKKKNSFKNLKKGLMQKLLTGQIRVMA